MSNPQEKPVQCIDAVDRVLAAAEELFATCGYDAVSISAIADRAQVSKANIFHHFQSKRLLYISVLKGAATHSTKLLAGIEETQSGFTERLQQLMHGQLDNYLSHPDKSKLLMREVLEDTSDAEVRVLQDEFAKNFSRVVSLIQKGQSAGELRSSVDPAIVAITILAANIFYFRTRDHLRELSEINFASDSTLYVNQVMDLLLNGMIQSA
ncbi:MAG: TetR/AcrR family transcriptional regulator [Gammaproteobacteria bacterium]